MGLDYLNKKVWHPGSMKNIQKVWEVEQVQRQLNKKNRERAKKLLQEQHNQELKRIQVEAGLIPRSHLDRMEWMYDWGNKINQQKTNEEFLTGKQQAPTPDSGQKKQFKHVFQEEITNRKCQDFQLLHEDPMYEIMKHEKARKDAIINNPIEMKNLIKEVQRQYMPQDFQERKQKHLSSRRRPSTSSSRSSSQESRKRKSKKHRKHKRERSRSKQRRSRSRSREQHHENRKSQKREEEDIKSEKKSFKQSKIYQEYLKTRFTGILRQDEQGNIKPDYSVHKKKYKTQIQLDEEERKKKIEELRQNAKKLQALREASNKNPKQDQKEDNFQHGVAKIRSKMFDTVRQNRNLKKYRASDQD